MALCTAKTSLQLHIWEDNFDILRIMKKLLVATRNSHKIPEIIAELDGLDFEVVSLNDVAEIPEDFEVEEDGKNFADNAVKKAKSFGKLAKLVTLADDSGISVDALGGEPGVYSARWIEGTAEDRNKGLLERLKGVPEKKRTARYISVIAIYDPQTDRLETCEGICEGAVTLEPIGDGGFGYDPIFFSVDLGKTMGQASMEEKNSVSHRGRALKKARKILKDFS